MTTVRRRVLRSRAIEPAVDPRGTARLERRRAQLAKDRVAFKRWLSKLKRATSTVGQLYDRIRRLEAQLNAAN
jgi:hypothetical protein